MVTCEQESAYLAQLRLVRNGLRINYPLSLYRHTCNVAIPSIHVILLTLGTVDSSCLRCVVMEGLVRQWHLRLHRNGIEFLNFCSLIRVEGKKKNIFIQYVPLRRENTCLILF